MVVLGFLVVFPGFLVVFLPLVGDFPMNFPWFSYPKTQDGLRSFQQSGN